MGEDDGSGSGRRSGAYVSARNVLGALVTCGGGVHASLAAGGWYGRTGTEFFYHLWTASLSKNRARGTSVLHRIMPMSTGAGSKIAQGRRGREGRRPRQALPAASCFVARKVVITFTRGFLAGGIGSLDATVRASLLIVT